MFFNIFNSAKAHIKGGKDFSKINGEVTFKSVPNGVLLTAKINGLPHSKGYCKRKFFWISYS